MEDLKELLGETKNIKAKVKNSNYAKAQNKGVVRNLRVWVQIYFYLLITVSTNPLHQDYSSENPRVQIGITSKQWVQLHPH